MSDEKEYGVGYKKPPATKQFKPGKSGNPKGRPRKSSQREETEKNLGKIHEEEMSRLITFKEKGKEKKITVRRALYKKLVQLGINKDDMQALKQMVALDLKYSTMRAEDEERQGGVLAIPVYLNERGEQLSAEEWHAAYSHLKHEPVEIDWPEDHQRGEDSGFGNKK